tara:strand:- start:7990 stop:9087 length:1098 start_codon:yes stop_codon:yes gene_type:complete
MLTSHPKLIEIVVCQTPRAMIAMLLVSIAYILIFIKYIPFSILLLWFFCQTFIAIYRFHNAKMFSKYLLSEEHKKIKTNETVFIFLIVAQSILWTISSILVLIYAPQPFEFVMFIVIIGVITASVLSMSSLYKAYLIFFFTMITPQILIMIYYGEHQHIGLVFFIAIYIPATILLSKSMLNTRIAGIEAQELIEKSAEAFRQLSITDNLTNIYNRRYFFEMAHNKILSANREQKTLCLLMLDIDLFKNINDSYGHQGGDYILKKLVDEIKIIIRKSDIFARVGGEEFVILLDDTSLKGAQVIAEKIRSAIENKHFNYNALAIKTTLSIGISELNKENIDIEGLYKKADKHLYMAKKQGRNKVCSL